jgi:TatA/E family protein of Tat protein translocase
VRNIPVLESGKFAFLKGMTTPAGAVHLDNTPRLSYDRNERAALFSGGFFEIGFILFIAFLLFGPKKLPEIARTLGKGLGELRRASNELKTSLEEEIKNLDRYEDSAPRSTPTYGHHDAQPTHEEPGPRS